MRSIFFLASLVALMLGSTVRAAEEAVGPVAPAIPPIRLSIATVESGKSGENHVSFYSKDSHFHVVLQNITDKPINIIGPGCSWGYDNLRLEMLDAKGTVTPINRVSIASPKNFLHHYTILAGDCYIFEIYPDRWVNFPLPPIKSQERKVTLRAVYEVPADAAAKKENAVSGKYVSAAKELVFIN